MYVLRMISLLLLMPLPALAIVNVEERRDATPKDGVQGTLELGLDSQWGNNDKRRWSGGINLNWQGQEHRFFAWGNRLYETSNGTRTDDDTFAHARLVLHSRERWSQEFFTQYERDPFARLQDRTLAGAGLRYQWPVSEDMRWFQGFGMFRERVTETSSLGDDTQWLTRASFYTHMFWRLPERYSLQSTLYLQPEVSDHDDLRALWQLSVTVPLTTYLSLKWQWQSRFDNRPPDNTERSNHETRLRLALYF